MINDSTKASNEEVLQLNEVLDDRNSCKWCHAKLCLHFFYLFLEEEVLIACRSMRNWETREVFDGRDSSSRPKAFFELEHNEFNDGGFRPPLNADPELHDDYLEPIDLFDDDEWTVPLVAPNKLKDQSSLGRCKVSCKSTFH